MMGGGIVRGGARVTIELHDDECMFGRDLACQRRDDRHHRQSMTVRTLCETKERVIFGPCIHRHVVPVESGGERVARLCLFCDAQLPA